MTPVPNPLHTWFLGPRGENEWLLKELLDSALQANLEWRRSYHPKDASPLNTGERTTPTADNQAAELRAEFAALLEQNVSRRLVTPRAEQRLYDRLRAMSVRITFRRADH